MRVSCARRLSSRNSSATTPRIHWLAAGVDHGEVRKPIVYRPDVQRTLLSMRARIMASRSLAYTAAGWFDVLHHSDDAGARAKAQRYIDLLMPVVKGWSTEIAQKVCYDAVQIHGGMGFVEETGVAQHYRDIRITTIYEGTTGIQANDLIGRKILREKGATLREFIAELATVAADLEAAGLGPLATRLAEDIDALTRVLDWVLARGKEELAAVLAGASPFLMLLGAVCATWQMGCIALAASRADTRQRWGEGYTQGLVDLAHFHAACLGPEVSSARSGGHGRGHDAGSSADADSALMRWPRQSGRRVRALAIAAARFLSG